VASGIDTELEPAGAHGPDPGNLTPEAAADVLFRDPKAPVQFVAADEDEARRATGRFARLFTEAPGVFREALNGAKAGAEALSGDRLQGLVEIIQNADDVGASQVTFQVVDRQLVATHNGHPVTLSDVLSLATPWLSNKRDNAVATGRFGIGLMTLRAISDVIDIHSGPYHVRLGDPTISAIEDTAMPMPWPDAAATAFCLPLRDAAVDTDHLLAWVARWDDSALLFLRHVKQVSVVGADGTTARALRLSWSDSEPSTCRVGDHQLTVRRRWARAADGRTWLVHSVNAVTPAKVRRLSKATDANVPLGLALPQHPERGGVVYAGLPIMRTNAPVRVNAQFDPVTSRSGLASTAWNDALFPLLADLWVEVVADLFTQRPASAWAVVPLPDQAGDEPIRALEDLLLDRSRTQLATTAAITIDGATFPLTELAVEEPALEGVIEPAEVATLAGLTQALPSSARDDDSRWRSVLDDWRNAGAALPPPVAVDDALILLRNLDRAPAATIRLTAAGLEADLANQLATLPCVVSTTGQHLLPPGTGLLHSLLTTESPLAEQLGIGIRLAADHLADVAPARMVLTWLRRIGAVIDGAGTEEVVRRLAAAGKAGNCLDAALTDDQLRALRDAFEQLPTSERSGLGPGVGRAIRIAAYTYDTRGRVVRTTARPVDAYLSRTIDREPASFAVAAGRAPRLVWTDNRYAEQLRSSLGRGAGLGAQKFLGLLGAERAPRLVPHRGRDRRYASDARLGVAAASGPTERTTDLRRLSASYTLDDLDSPDLRAAALDIAKDRKALRRRERAAAMLSVLARAWDRLREGAQVDAADTNYGWQVKGSTRAFWLWSIGAIAWLDDTGGVPRAPFHLKLKTAGTVAVHGPKAPGYVRPEFDTPIRREVLVALGVAGEPSTRDLVARLRHLRAAEPVPDTLATDAAIIYRALADRLSTRDRVPGDLTERELRNAFSDGSGLVHTNLGWQLPADVLAGPPIFRHHRAFTPHVTHTERLWTVLGVRQPSLEDCLRIIGQLARSRQPPQDDDEVVALETLRLLAERLSATPHLSSGISRRLIRLPLFTSQGWTTKRPVYAVDDPVLADGLRGLVPVWQPGGELSQFAGLLSPLRVTRLGADAVTVVAPESARCDDDATTLYAAAVSLLQVDLARNDPATAGLLSLSWDQLRALRVHIDPDLRVQVDGLAGHGSIQIEVTTKADAGRETLFLRHADLLSRVDGAGRAVAGLFATADFRQLAQAWLAACVAAAEGQTAQRLQLAEQQAAEERERNQQIIDRTAALAQQIADRHSQHQPRRPSKPTNVAPGRSMNTGGQPASSPQTKPRTLVDPSRLTITDVNGRPSDPPRPSPPTTSRQSNTPLPQPNRNIGPPRGHTPAASFTSLDKESVGLQIARLVLGGDADEIADLRAQHGAGADAIDSLQRYFELKVYVGDEPDSIQLEKSQIRRALSTPDFFLVVVSNIEGPNARPRVRVIADPVNQLSISPSSSVYFSGVRSAEHSLVYDLAHIPTSEDRQ
jgi:hypothetical protein